MLEGSRSRSRYVVVTLLASLLVLAGGTPHGHAQQDDQESVPEGIIVSAPESFVEIWTDQKVYRPGDTLQIHLKLDQEAYVYVYDIDAEGRVTLLFPNGFSRDNHLAAGQHTLPDSQSYSLRVTEPLGVESLQVIGARRPLPILSLSARGETERHPFPELAVKPQALKTEVLGMIDATQASREWAAAWTHFLVASAVTQLRIRTDPPGAHIYVNGELRGRTPTTLFLRPGEVRLDLEKQGYLSWSRTLALENRVSMELQVQLERAPSLPQPTPNGERGIGSLPAAPLRLGFNAGLNDQGVFSVGADFGVSAHVSLGAAVSFSGDEVPKFNDVGAPVPFVVERVYNLGPESEAYLTLSLPIRGPLLLQVGGGVAAQRKAHVAGPGGEVIVSGLHPFVEIVPNGYTTTESHLTVSGGATLEFRSSALSAGYHSRRGWILGLGLHF